jgi:pimeloyl-ACP methyl ester carboxylesterase
VLAAAGRVDRGLLRPLGAASLVGAVIAAQFDPWPQLDRATCPTLVLAGGHDPVATGSAARRLAAALPNADARLHLLPDAGHGVFREAPEKSCALLRAFLAHRPLIISRQGIMLALLTFLTLGVSDRRMRYF